MSEKILFVDDDRQLLASMVRIFARTFALETAESGEAGLLKLAQSGPFAVVVADRQMPNMNGFEFLAEVKKLAPQSVRIMLTGDADHRALQRLVDQERIFRFLSKPCPAEVLAKALREAQAEYRLLIAANESAQLLGGH
jgi:DNA-binding NtrC family response regulator